MKYLQPSVLLILIFAASSCSPVSSEDNVRIERIVESWSPHSPYEAGGPFSGHKEWCFGPESETERWLDRLNRWEAEEHAKIDSLSNVVTMKPIKDALHDFVRCAINIYRIDATFPGVASTIRPEFLRNRTLLGDSVLGVAQKLLARNDTLANDIQSAAERFNRLSRNLGLSDTLRYRKYQAPRRQILYEYVWFLSPEEKEYLLTVK